MTSKRTISYIGLWALIMPWLGFSWETKTVLFSLTGILLLIIGNRQYINQKKIQKLGINSHKEDLNNQSSTPNNMIENSTIINDDFNHSVNNATQYIPKQRIKRDVETMRPVRKITARSNKIVDGGNTIENEQGDLLSTQ